MAGAIVESWWLLFLLERLRLKQQLLSEPVKEDISNSQVKNPQVKNPQVKSGNKLLEPLFWLFSSARFPGNFPSHPLSEVCVPHDLCCLIFGDEDKAAGPVVADRVKPTLAHYFLDLKTNPLWEMVTQPCCRFFLGHHEVQASKHQANPGLLVVLDLLIARIAFAHGQRSRLHLC